MVGYNRRVKILVLGDLHYTRRRPKRRVDNFVESVSRKMTEIVDISSGAQLVLLTGDMFHSRLPSWQEFVDVATWLSRIKAPKIICAGNHDLVGGNYDSVDRMPLGIIRSLGLARVPTGLVEEMGLTIFVLPYSPTRDAEDYRFDGSVDLLVTHDLLYPEERQLPFEYRHPMSIPSVRAKAVICGHVHLQTSGPFQSIDVSSNKAGASWTTEFVWPGPIIRGCTSHEFAQVPSVVWLDVGHHDCRLDFVRLSSAKPFEEAFDVQAYEEEKRYNAEFDEFVISLRKAGMRQEPEDVFAMVRHSEAYGALPDNIRRYVEGFLQEVERGSGKA